MDYADEMALLSEKEDGCAGKDDSTSKSVKKTKVMKVKCDDQMKGLQNGQEWNTCMLLRMVSDFVYLWNAMDNGNRRSVGDLASCIQKAKHPFW